MPLSETMNKTTRIISYDLFRGVLVIAMISYHVFANLHNSTISHWLSLARVSIGFVYITWIITWQFLLEKKKKQWSIISKLLSIYIITNIIIGIQSNHTRQTIIETIISGQQNTTSFEILLPISLTIFIGSIRGKYSKKSQKKTLVSIAIIIALLLTIDQLGIYIFSMNFTLYGILGTLIGAHYKRENISTKLRTTRYRKYLLIITTIVITRYLTKTSHTNIMIPLFHTCLIYWVSHNVAQRRPSKRITKRLTNIGKFSLLIYIIHIGIIKILDHYIQTIQRTTALIITVILIAACIICTGTKAQKFINTIQTGWKKSMNHLHV